MSEYQTNPAGGVEDHLPPGQKLIETHGVIKLRNITKFLMRSKDRTGYWKIAVITGKAGIGKTIAVQAFVDTFPPRSHTGLPAVIKVKVKPDSTPKALALDIISVLADKPRGRNRYELADEVAAAIIRNELELLIIDEADRLTEASFELLRHIHDQTGCPIALVGLPEIWRVIRTQEKFASRVGLKMEFPSLVFRSEEPLRCEVGGNDLQDGRTIVPANADAARLGQSDCGTPRKTKGDSSDHQGGSQLDTLRRSPNQAADQIRQAA